jgi:uncharacterized protein YlxP (DUF503 family)
MYIRIIQINLLIPGAQSLKDKRQVLRSLITRLRQKFNISIAETAFQDEWQHAELGIAYLSNQMAVLESIQQELLKLIEREYPVEMTGIEINDY